MLRNVISSASLSPESPRAADHGGTPLGRSQSQDSQETSTSGFLPESRHADGSSWPDFINRHADRASTPRGSLPRIFTKDAEVFDEQKAARYWKGEPPGPPGV